MKQWHSTSIPAHQQETERLALLTTSGNIPSSSLDYKDGIENQDPSLYRHHTVQHTKSEYQYPPPSLTLTSNDHVTDNLRRLQARRERKQRRHDADPRPYLKDENYMKYRTRQRMDVGTDGSAVWDDRVEDAFQNGMLSPSKSVSNCIY